MADLSELESKFMQADALALKGDEQAKLDASLFASEIKKLRAAPPSITDDLVSGVKTGFQRGGVIGAAVGAIPAGTRALDEAAYASGGKVTELASRAGASPENAAGLGFGTNVLMQAIPAVIGSGGGKAAAPLLDAAATRAMQSSIKPLVKDLKSAKAVDAIQTMLDEGILATKGGMAKLRGEIDNLNREIADGIRNSVAPIDKYAAWSSIKETLDRFTRQVSPSADTAKIQQVWHDFLDHPLISGDLMPVQLAQELKQGTYKVLSKKYGEIGSADTEAQKAIARGLKEEIATAVPDIAGLNARESKLLTALDVSERRILLAANNNISGLATLAHDPTAWALFMADKSGPFKSLAAILLHKGRERIPQAAVGAGIAGIEALQPGYVRRVD